MFQAGETVWDRTGRQKGKGGFCLGTAISAVRPRHECTEGH